MPSIGEQLRAARHAKKASLEDAARATKIKLETLERLEADEFKQLAAPMYIRGFIKNYAAWLGLDGNAMAEAYIRSQGGLRRQGIQLETEATIRERRAQELHLPIVPLVAVVAGLTLVVAVGYGIRTWWTARKHQPAPAHTLPHADVDEFYKPKKPIAADLLDQPSR